MATSLGDIYTHLVRDGVLDGGKDTYHGLQVALAGAVKKGDATRVRPGVYQSSSAENTPTLTNFQREDGDGS